MTPDTFEPPPTYAPIKSSAAVLIKEADGIDEVVDEVTLIRRLLTRAPIADSQLRLYQELYKAGDRGMSNKELSQALSITSYQFAGVLGALGKRVEGTPGSKHFGGIGINLLFEIEHVRDRWEYRLRPVFRTVLEEDGLV